MSQPTGHTRICPTRIDGASALFTHKVTVPQCQDRQRGRYHKCYTCSYNNGYLAQAAKRKPPAVKLATRLGKKASVQEPEPQVAAQILGPVFGPPLPPSKREAQRSEAPLPSGGSSLESLPAPA